MRAIKSVLKWLLIVLLGINALILITGNSHIYKGIANTYLKGRKGPSINEYSIFYNRKIKAGTIQPWKNSLKYNSYSLSSDEEEYHTKLETTAFLVIKNDSVLFENYYQGSTDTSISNSFSMAKTFVSIITGIALQENKIKSIDQPIGDYLENYNTDEGRKITIKHLLTMSSGIDFDEDYVSPFAYPAKAYYGSDLKKLTLGYKQKDEPGKTFKYLSGNTELLSFVLEKATGKTISEYLSEKLWIPIGASKDALWNLDHADGNEKAYCCFISTAKDFARLGKLYLDSGKWNGKQIVPASYVINSVQPADLLRENGNKNDLYGYSWWLIPNYNGHYVYYARGILGQYILVVPDQKLIIVRLGNKREKVGDEDHPSDVFEYLKMGLKINSHYSANKL